MKRRVFAILIPVAAALLSVIIVLSLVFGAKKYPEPQRDFLPDEAGRDVYGVCISDLKEKNYIKYAYYTPDRFLSPTEGSVTGEEVDISAQKNIAKRGTYQFIIYNLNPEDEDFRQKKQALAPYLQSDNSWHFSLYLPPCFSACCVYVRSVNRSSLAASAGEIAGYDYIEYSDKQGYSEQHTDGTQPVFLDLAFYSGREALENEFLRRAAVVTVHYESDGIKVGFDGVPVIGAGNAVKRAIAADQVFLTVIALAAAFVFVVLAFACILKKSLFAVPQATLAWGVAGFTNFKLLSYSAASAPRLLYVCVPICACIILAAAVLSMIYAIKTRKSEFLIAPPIALTFGVSFFVLPFYTPLVPSPAMWLAVIMLSLTAFSAFAFFADLERRNVYLTDNLKSEVARQTEDLNTIISERDKLLRYLSHDMKKPVSGIKHFVAEIRKNETNEENIKALDIIDAKLDGMQSDFSELQKFAKQNFAAEACQTLYTDRTVQSVYERLSPDCEANGISLKINAPKIAVFAKRNILNSVIDNLVFNAVEHSQCSNITISAVKSSGVCRITVTDDGTGIENERDVFRPYYSENGDADNLGLGLYICRQHMLSMGGDLTYSRENGKTVFTIILNLA